MHHRRFWKTSALLTQCLLVGVNSFELHCRCDQWWFIVNIFICVNVTTGHSYLTTLSCDLAGQFYIYHLCLVFVEVANLQLYQLESKLKKIESDLRESHRQNSILQSQLAAQSSHDPDASTNHSRALSHSSPSHKYSQFHTTIDSIHINSQIPSFYALPDAEDIVPDEAKLSHMTQHELRDIINALQSELIKSRNCSTEMQHKLDALSGSHGDTMFSGIRGDTPGENEADVETRVGNLRLELSEVSRQRQLLEKQVESLTRELNESKGTNLQLERQLATVLYGPTSDKDIRIIPVLKEQLSEARKQVSNLEACPNALGDLQQEVGRLQSQLTHTESVNSLLKRQVELNAQNNDEFNPELMCQMAEEIERLKNDREERGERKTGKGDIIGSVI